MNKIVLLNSPMDLIIDKRHFPPLGLASIAALLRSKGYVCDVIDGDLPVEDLLPEPGEETELTAGEGGEMPGMDGMPEEEEDEFAKNEEILNLRMQRSLRLKQNISEFVDQNPQIAAKLVQSWLRGEEDTDGRSRNAGHRKQSK